MGQVQDFRPELDENPGRIDPLAGGIEESARTAVYLVLMQCREKQGLLQRRIETYDENHFSPSLSPGGRK